MNRWASNILSALLLSALSLAFLMPISLVFAQDGGGGQAVTPTPKTQGTGSSGGGAADTVAGTLALPVMKPAQWLLEGIVVPLASVIMTITGQIFDFTVDYTFKSTNMVTGNSGDMISYGWTLVRDLCNIAFIFTLIYASIEVILGRGDAKKTITNVIIAALLVNFSLFFTKALIDISNLFAATFKSAIDAVVSGSGAGTMSEFINVRLQMTALYSGKFFSLADQTKSILNALIRTLLMLVTAYTFFQAALIFLGRLVTLFFLMIFSPFGFVGMLGGKLSEFSSDWWKNMKDAMFVMPTFMFTLYIIMRLIGSDQFGNAISVGTSGGVANLGWSIEQYFVFFLIIFLFQKAVKTAKDMAGDFGKLALTAGNTLAGAALGAGVGVTAFAGRATLGRAAASIAKNEAVKNTLRQTSIGRLAYKGIDKTASATFDVRNVKTAGSILGAAGIDGINIGKGGKGGAVERDKKAAEADAKFYGKIGLADSRGYDAAKKARDEAKEAKDDAKQTYDAAYDALIKDSKSGDPTVSKDANDKLKALSDAETNAAKTYKATQDSFAKTEKEFIDAQKGFVDKLANANFTGTVVSKAGSIVAEAVGKTLGVTTNLTGNAIGLRNKELKGKLTVEDAGKVYSEALEAIFKGENSAIIDRLRKEAKKKASDKDKEKKNKNVSKIIEDAVGEKKDAEK
jgi:hypothetical protein